jgi:hypothetical protein
VRIFCAPGFTSGALSDFSAKSQAIFRGKIREMFSRSISAAEFCSILARARTILCKFWREIGGTQTLFLAALRNSLFFTGVRPGKNCFSQFFCSRKESL